MLAVRQCAILEVLGDSRDFVLGLPPLSDLDRAGRYIAHFP